MLILLGGVSGSGKDTIKNAILERMDNVVSIPSYTSRPMREGDIPGITYNFVSQEEFKKLIDDGELYEYDFHHDNFYGTSKRLLNARLDEGLSVIKDIDVNGIANLKKIFEGDMKVISIFLRVPKDILVQRIKDRNPDMTEEELELRLSRMEYEESKIPEFDYVVDNINLDDTISTIVGIIENEVKKEEA